MPASPNSKTPCASPVAAWDHCSQSSPSSCSRPNNDPVFPPDRTSNRAVSSPLADDGENTGGLTHPLKVMIAKISERKGVLGEPIRSFADCNFA